MRGEKGVEKGGPEKRSDELNGEREECCTLPHLVPVSFSAGAMDTLSVLREFTRAGRLGEVSLSSAGRVRFGADFDFDAAAPTGYVRGSGGGASAASDRYTAGALAFFAAISGFASAGAGAYMRAAREAGVPTVAVLDIKARAERR